MATPETSTPPNWKGLREISDLELPTGHMWEKCAEYGAWKKKLVMAAGSAVSYTHLTLPTTSRV